MNGEKQCWTCVYGENMTGNIFCMNRTVQNLQCKPDPYCCEFYDEITESYVDDMRKVELEC